LIEPVVEGVVAADAGLDAVVAAGFAGAGVAGLAATVGAGRAVAAGAGVGLTGAAAAGAGRETTGGGAAGRAATGGGELELLLSAAEAGCGIVTKAAVNPAANNAKVRCSVMAHPR
jgi:hypothetical protein